MEIFEKLPDEINHLVSEFSSTPVVGDLSCGITQYSFWLIVSTIVLLIVLAVFKKKQTLVPKGFFVNGFEYIIEYVENDIGKGVVGENWKKHFPFLCSLFLFILINNMIGLIPGMKPGTGAIGSTAALAIFAFVYFIYYGCKAHGVIGYIKSLAPQGVSFPMNVLVWVVELFSTFLRLITLAVRLFCNMFAGHVVMGSFAIMRACSCSRCFSRFPRLTPSAPAFAGLACHPHPDLCDRACSRRHPGLCLHGPYRRVCLRGRGGCGGGVVFRSRLKGKAIR